MRITTYSDTGTTAIDSQSVGFAVTAGQVVTVSIDPSLTFAVNAVTNTSQSVNGTSTTVTTTNGTIPFGTVTSSSNAVAAHDLVVTTNAANGYTVYVKYTGALSDGNSHTIADVSGSNATPAVFTGAGTSGFGYTTQSTTLSGGAGTGSGQASRFASSKYAALTSSNIEVARATTAVSSDTTRIGYQVGVSGTQAAGAYTTTVVLTATPTY